MTIPDTAPHRDRRPALQRSDRPSDSVEEAARRIRERVLQVVAKVEQGYLLQGLGSADLLAALYFAELRIDPADPAHPDRDRCLLSTAHNSAALYATFAECGLLPEGELAGYGQDGSPLEIIASERVPGVEGTFGSLGQGLSVGVGLALSARRRGLAWRTYVVLGDGEMQEGQTWEAAMAASAFALGNLCLVVDLNRMQVEGHTDEVLPMGEVAAKWQAFGWHVQEIDGHDVEAILAAFAQARRTTDAPSVIVARTVPGHPISFLTGEMQHYARLSVDARDAALAELRGAAR